MHVELSHRLGLYLNEVISSPRRLERPRRRERIELMACVKEIATVGLRPTNAGGTDYRIIDFGVRFQNAADVGDHEDVRELHVTCKKTIGTLWRISRQQTKAIVDDTRPKAMSNDGHFCVRVCA